MIIAWRSVLTVLLLVAAWQAVTLNLSQHFLNRAFEGSDSALDASLWWHEHPDAVALRARRSIGREDGAGGAGSERGEIGESGGRDRDIIEFGPDVEEAVTGLQRSLALNPTRPRTAATLARLYAAAGNSDARAMAGAADRLGPVDWRAQNDIGVLFLDQDRLDAALPHIARAMVGNRELARDYYPALALVASDPQTLPLLQPIAEDPRVYKWWGGFFRYLAREAATVEPLRGVVNLREQARSYPLQPSERDQYVQRLRRDGLMTEAYLYWVNGLPPEQLEGLGYIFDGGFQRAFDNASGFGWNARPPRNSGIRISRGDTYGASDDVALRLSFRGRRVRFSHVWQHLFVPPGAYTVNGRVRPDQLRARRGLQWRVSCDTGGAGTIAESELFSGTGDWREFSFSLSVPQGCDGQTLRLYSAGNRVVDHELAGTIWFDDLRIEQLR